MSIGKLVLASVAAISISSAALAQEFQTTGRIMKIDQASGKITLQHKQGGTVGAATTNNLVDEYKIQDGLKLNGLQVGDPVAYTEAQVDNVWTVTKIQKQ
jgi:Cu/Ag efflux protein CusF